MDQHYSFQQVFEEECKHLEQLHREAGPAGAGFARDQLMGLALSGGGIRSATFNLGVLQALAEARLLEQFDYLSTVSGGGYIGSWLSAWINRRDEANRAQEQAQSEQPGAQVEHKPGVTSVQQELGSSLDRDEEPAPVRFLRSYSNYLTPKTGLLSSDTLAAVATYLRNFMLNVAILVACLVAVLLLPRVAASIGSVLRDAPCAALLIGVVALAFAIWFIELNLATQLPQSTRRAAWYAKRKAILLSIVVPLVVAGLALSYWLIRADNQAWVTGARTAKWFALVLVAGTASIALLWIAALRVAQVERIRYDRPNWGWRLLGLVTGIAVGLAALMCLQKMFGDSVDSGLWHATVSGLPALFGVFGLGAVFVIGTSGRQFEEDSREWWSRLGGVLIAVALIWFLVAAAAIYAPWGVMQLPHVMQGLSLGWLATTLAGLQAARSGSTGAPGSNTWLDLLARVAPYVFIAGLLVALACGIHALVAAGAADASAPAAWSMADWAVYAPAAAAWLIGPRQWLLFAAAMVVTAFLSWRVDVNVFSFHMFYRNRLIRCYLGASNPRRAPQSFTGFDRSDSPNLKDLVQRPYHLLNTALNITKGDRLAWQERKAASFVLSPLFCGYEIDNADGGTIHGYQPTSQYVAQAQGSLGLGTALAISGAAASPNMGYHSTPAAAFLMTVFNLRLGWWMQNPARPQQWQREGPRWGFLYLLSELLGAANEQSKFVYLSDGGHFDNLGIYELVRRRCRFIMVVDAGCDTGFEFEDLGNAIRKCKIDMGVSIDIDAGAIVPTDGRSRLHCAVGTIHYEHLGSEAVEGYLLYIKPSLTGNEPADVLQYAKAHPAFPHEPTSDQWFAESQFESYRTLGQHIARTVFDGANVLASQEREAVFVALRERWYPASGAVKQWFSRHADQLKRLQTQLRSDEQLRFLDAQIYPEWDRLMAGRTEAYPSDLSLPRTAAEARAGFYFCASLLDLMEAIYVDLDLEEEYGHPDNRGWMNLFRHWSWSSMFRATYAICCASHGGRFERFCERRLDLSRGEVRIETMNRAEALDAFLTVQEHAGRLNFVETGLIRQYAAEGVRFDKIVLLRVRVADPSKPTPPGVAALEFTFGFALVDGRGIVYLRVQDHLRRMSLAREALRKMARSGYTEISKDARGDDAEAVRRFRLLHSSVLRELQVG
jgi:predicted acylesterase/phospholipase RssA